MPSCAIVHIETPNPLNPIGVKGAGEGGAIPSPAAVIAAVEDALSPFGVRFREMPLSPERIVAALREAGAYDKLEADEHASPALAVLALFALVLFHARRRAGLHRIAG